MAADAGCLGIVTTSTPTAIVAPTFGAEAKLGTNPIALAAPAMRNRPFLLDIATSTVSRGVLAERWRSHGRVPQGWAIDARGRPLTSGASAVRHGRLTPLGGDREHGSHKGYGLAVAVEILSALLPGLPLRQGPGPRADVGHWALAIDPSRFRDAEAFAADVDALLDDLRLTSPVDGRSPVLVPGDPETATLARRTAEGIPLSRAVWEAVRGVARASGAPFVLEGR
jgi:LDH2 family malate/lactate/ureidoglycolate dehydrogenase